MIRVMLVDDHDLVRALMKERLDRVSGIAVVAEACDGEAAIDAAKAERPDVVLLDVNMPGLDGYGVCETMREMGSQYDRLPIVFLTSVESRALELLGHEFGAYLNKPVQPEELLDVVEDLLAQAGPPGHNPLRRG